MARRDLRRNGIGRHSSDHAKHLGLLAALFRTAYKRLRR